MKITNELDIFPTYKNDDIIAKILINKLFKITMSLCSMEKHIQCEKDC